MMYLLYLFLFLITPICWSGTGDHPYVNKKIQQKADTNEPPESANKVLELFIKAFPNKSHSILMWGGSSSYSRDRSHQPTFSIKNIEKYKYDEELSKDAPLSEDLSLNTYWQSLKDKSQAEKDAALEQLSKDIIADRDYPLLRRNIHSAIKIGANPNVKDLPERVVNKDDIALLELMIKKGLNVRAAQNNLFEPLIFSAKTKAIADLLLANGADIHSKERYLKSGLLSAAMSPYNESELASFYLEQGQSPFECDPHGFTPLHCLAQDAWQPEAIVKAALLFKNLRPHEIISLINLKNMHGDTVLDILSQDEDQNLLPYLESTLEKAHSKIFYDQMATLVAAKRNFWKMDK